MCPGGADRASFQRRHVLPDDIDPNSVLCRLIDDSTRVLVTAPYLSLVSKLVTSRNRPMVDYVLGLDGKGMQYLKRYNSKNVRQTTRHSTRSTRSNSRAAREQANNNWLHQLMKSSNERE